MGLFLFGHPVCSLKFSFLLVDFLPRDAMLSTVYGVVVCVCVCHTLVLYQNG